MALRQLFLDRKTIAPPRFETGKKVTEKSNISSETQSMILMLLVRISDCTVKIYTFST